MPADDNALTAGKLRDEDDDEEFVFVFADDEVMRDGHTRARCPIPPQEKQIRPEPIANRHARAM